ncbi:MAG TPA: zinc-dependent metalloprotease [Pirellulales bacterium]|nr:zinc-dependent metalloprotease [Pirellulales bacterium]
MLSRLGLLVPGVLLLLTSAVVIAEETKPTGDKSPAAKSDAANSASGSTTAKSTEAKADNSASSDESSSGGSGREGKSKYAPFATVTKDYKSVSGLVPLFHKEGSVLAEFSNSTLNRDFIVVISIARGIGHGQILGGMSWGGNGEDAIWQFRKVDDHIQVVRRNVRFTAAKGSPEERAVGIAYTDSIMFSLPITSISPSGGYIVDLNQIFMTDFPEISHDLPGYSFSANRSTWAEVRGYPDNVELEVAATYGSAGLMDLDSVPDSRAVTINIHYSLSLLPQNGYRPRLADDRVGYFVTAMKDYSHKVDDDRFVRYITRWDLQKAEPSAEQSPPKKPIIFWLEKTVPFKFRKPIREGILEWNKAFEKAGFLNAIEVRQQPDNADWDAEDVNYNTFRWITSSAGFAMGPSRANPLNGQILNASIIFDADFLRFWKTEYEVFTPHGIAALTGGALDLQTYEEEAHHGSRGHALDDHCNLEEGESRQFAFGSAVLMGRAGAQLTDAEQDRLVAEGLKEVTMHEVGHTLGLRHNFKASSQFSLEDINNPEKTKESGMGSSVMDYYPVNVVPAGVKQGNFYSPTIGSYDMWAIEYGYKPISASDSEGEVAELNKIAARSGEPGLSYSPDEDTRGIDSDPLSNRFDLGNDPVAFAKQRAKVVNEVWPKLVDKVTKEGDGYQRVRQAFGVLLSEEGESMYFAARYVGGVYVSRSHKGDAHSADPYVVAEPAKQRDALKLMEEQVFNDAPFQFPPSLYNHMAATRWSHWGSEVPPRNDYPVHQVIALWQDRILQQLLSPLTLTRISDSELKVPADQDAFTAVELIHGLTAAIFAETEKLPAGDYTNRKPAISSLRRNLQRIYLKRLSGLAMGETQAPPDCQTIAYSELKSLEERIDKLLKDNTKLDDYSKAHLLETSNRIAKVTDARLLLKMP